MNSGRRSAIEAAWPWLFEPLWHFDQNPQSAFSLAYHWFNIVEGVAWCVFGVLVLARFARYRRSWLELPYAGMFFLFGATDFREAYVLSVPLIAAKGAVLAALLTKRHFVLRWYYPDRKLF